MKTSQRCMPDALISTGALGKQSNIFVLFVCLLSSSQKEREGRPVFLPVLLDLQPGYFEKGTWKGKKTAVVLGRDYWVEFLADGFSSFGRQSECFFFSFSLSLLTRMNPSMYAFMFSQIFRRRLRVVFENWNCAPKNFFKINYKEKDGQYLIVHSEC